MKQKKQDVLLGESTGEPKSNSKFVKRNDSRNETTDKRNDTNDNNRKRKSETKNQSQVHNKKPKTLEADKNVSYEKAKGMILNSDRSTVLFAGHETHDSPIRLNFFHSTLTMPSNYHEFQFSLNYLDAYI